MICSRCRLFVPLWFLYFDLTCLINYSANFSAFILSLSTCLSLVFKGNVHRCPVSLAPRLAYLLAQTEYQLSTWELSFLHSPLNVCRVFLLPGWCSLSAACCSWRHPSNIIETQVNYMYRVFFWPRLYESFTDLSCQLALLTKHEKLPS